jgi:hypothetical protein
MKNKNMEFERKLIDQILICHCSYFKSHVTCSLGYLFVAFVLDRTGVPEEDDCGVPWVFQLIHNLEILTVKTQKIIN